MEELVEKLQTYLTKKKNPYLTQVGKDLDLEEYQIYGLLEMMKKNGYVYEVLDKRIVKMKPIKEQNEITIPSKQGQIKFVAISDIHYASKWDNPKLVERAYEIAEKEGCDFVTNSGDIFEGDFHNKRPEHIYQVKKQGIEQLDYVVEKYPKSEIPTYYITGNHSATFEKTCGADIGKMLADKRSDLTYLGHDIGDIKVNGLKIRLRHGVGSGSYAKSYKLQKYCETLPINDIPNIILQGHFHYSGYFKNRDIHCFNVPSLQSYTPYAKSLGLPQELGFWYIECNVDEKGNLVSIVPELYQFEEKNKTKKKVR